MRAEEAIQYAPAGLIKASCDSGIVTIYRPAAATPEYHVRFVPRGSDHILKLEEMILIGNYPTVQQADEEVRTRYSVSAEAWHPQHQVELVENQETGGLQIEPPEQPHSS